MPAAWAGDGLHQPLFRRRARLGDDLGADCPLGGPFREGQGNEGAAEAEDGREDEQSVEIEALFIEVGLDPQQAQGDRQHQHHGQIGC